MDKVRIWWKEYQIKYEPVVDVEDALGFILFREKLIRIKQGPDEGATLLHEIFHAVLKHMGVPQDENLISALTMNLWGVFKDNPKLLDYFKKESGG